MMAPDLMFWTRLLARVAVEAACVLGVAMLVERFVRSAFWRRTGWQAAVVCLLILTASELTGFGGGLASWLFGHARVERKFLLTASLVESGAGQARAIVPSFTQPPVAPPMISAEPEPVGSVWWPGILWLAGALLIAGRILVAQILLISLRQRRVKMNGNNLRERVGGMLRRLGTRRDVCLIESPGLSGPMAFGIWRASIGLPVDFATRHSPAEQDAMLAHELAHLAAHDPLWYLLADASSAVLWWHPPVWWARHRLHRASEQAADEAAVIIPDGPAVLAECLVNLGKNISGRAGAGSIGVEGGFRSNLAERVQRLLAMETTSQPPAFGWKAQSVRCGTIMAIAAGAITLSGCLQNHDTIKQPTLSSNLSKSWQASPASTVWHSVIPLKNAEATPAPILVADPPVQQKVSGVEKGKDTVAALVADGKLLYELGRYDEAEAQLKKAIKLDPSNTAASYYMELIKVARYVDYGPVGAGGTKSELLDVDKESLVTNKREFPPISNPYANTNLTHTSKGRQTILQKLQTIPYNLDKYESDTSLIDVIKDLQKNSKNSDLEKIGITFEFNPHAGGVAGAASAAPTAFAAASMVDPKEITVKITPPLYNLTLIQAMEAICKRAKLPAGTQSGGLTYSIDEYAVWFFLKTNEPVPLYIRTFRVDPKTFNERFQGVNSATPSGSEVSGSVGGTRAGGGDDAGSGGGSTVSGTVTNGGGASGLTFITTWASIETNHAMVVLAYFRSMGINLGTNDGKYVFFNSRTGDLLIRDTWENLYKVAHILDLIPKTPAGETERYRNTNSESIPVLNASTNNSLPTIPHPIPLASKSFHIGTINVIQAMQASYAVINGSGDSPGAVNAAGEQRIPSYLMSDGEGGNFVNMGTNEGKFVSFNLGTGDLLVRASEEDLAKVVQVLDEINKPVPQMTVDVKFVSLSQVTNLPNLPLRFNALLENTTNALRAPSTTTPANSTLSPTPTWNTNANGASFANPSSVFPGTGRSGTNIVGKPAVASDRPTVVGILNAQQSRDILDALDQQSGAEVLSMPRLTILSGRQAHLAVTDVVTGIGGMQSVATDPTGATNTLNTGPDLDLLPTVAADGYAIKMALISTYTEFVGYDPPGQSVPTQIGMASGSNAPGNLPLPHYRLRQIVETVNVWDCQTIVLGGSAPEILTIGQSPTNRRTNNFMIFVTPRIIDAAGNRVHKDEDMPFSKTTIPPQPLGTGLPK